MRRRVCGLAAAIAASVSAPAAFAFEIPFDNPDLSLNWDTTFKYSNAARLLKASDALTSGSVSAANQDDGDRSFKRGLISNRLDIFTEADLKYRSFGGRVSAAGWYDTVYNRGNSNYSSGTSNNVSVATNEFETDTRNIMGRKAELLDAFVFGKATLGDVPVNVRAGRHALQWGESLFFGANAIAGAMVPLDIVKAAQIPNSLTREIVRPVGQVSGTAELTSNISMAGYYQYQWDKSRLPPVGSYFSPGDIFDGGGECLRTVIGPACSDRGAGLPRVADTKAKDSGQFGLRFKYSDKQTGVDYGLYALRFHSKTPALYLNSALIPNGPPVPVPVSYRTVYPENIKLVGASVAFQSGAYQWSGEVSMRRNSPLVGSAPPVGPTFDNNDNPAYAVGNTAHAQVSLLATLPESFIASTATLLGELAWNRTLSVTRNPNALSPTASRDALAFRLVYAPAYNQVLDGVDITVPLGLGYAPMGKSSAISQFATDHGGDMTIGVSGAYLSVWQFGLTYRHFFGATGLTQDATNQFTYQQAFKDRDFVSLSVSRTY